MKHSGGTILSTGLALLLVYFLFKNFASIQKGVSGLISGLHPGLMPANNGATYVAQPNATPDIPTGNILQDLANEGFNWG